MVNIIYPTLAKIIEYNKLLIQEIKVKKKDKAHLLSKRKLEECILECKNIKGDIYDKAVCLLKGIIQKHAFASGNRRTAFFVTERFLEDNHKKILIKNIENQARVLQGIREGFYTDEEIKHWIMIGEIHEFKRR